MKKQGKHLTPFQRKLLKKSLETQELRPEYQRRIKVMLLADEGLTKAKICQILECTKETARYWVGQAKAGQAHNWRDYPRGRPKTINAEYLARLKELATDTPRNHGYPFERWTGCWLSKHLSKELDIELSPGHVNRLLKQMGLSTRKKSAVSNNFSNNKDIEISNIRFQELSSAP